MPTTPSASSTTGWRQFLFDEHFREIVIGREQRFHDAIRAAFLDASVRPGLSKRPDIGL
jgi:hypothetical protein